MAVIVGDKARFAVEAIPIAGEGRWISGHFRFWVGGEPAGDWDDYADLRSCANWLVDFAKKPVDRVEPLLEKLPAADIARRVYDASMTRRASKLSSDYMALENAYGRFYISHLGMSSFDALDVIVVFTSEGEQRLVWRDRRDGRIGEARLRKGEMERVALQASEAIYAELDVFEEP